MLKTPDITPAQIIAAIGAVVSELLAAGVIDGRTAQLVVGLAGAIVPLALVIADAIIRHGRSQIAAAQVMEGSRPAA